MYTPTILNFTYDGPEDCRLRMRPGKELLAKPSYYLEKMYYFSKGIRP